MTRTTLLIGSIPLMAFLAGCTEGPEPTSPPVDAASLAPASPASAMHTSSAAGPQVLMLDACDPESFNTAFGFEVCTPTTPRAGVSFSTFVALLEEHQRVEAWRFSPGVIHVTRAVTMAIPNKGGIPHSFTEVEEFGGGFVPFLNLLSGNPDPAPECVHPEDPNAPHPNVMLVAPGEHDTHTFHPGEAKKFMCCIHPWMRAVSR